LTAFWSPTRQSWSPKATVGFSAIRLQGPNLHERHFGSVEASLLIIGESRKDALMIAELVLRDHEPPELSTEPTIEPSPPPTKFAMRRSIDPTRGQDPLRPSDMNAGLSH
jgi:hypothetical protein